MNTGEDDAKTSGSSSSSSSDSQPLKISSASPQTSLQDNSQQRYSLGGTERIVAYNTTDPSVIPGLNNEGLDWVLTNHDKKNSEPQTLEEELKRLQALRSYLILDSEREGQFERLTALASRILNVPIALVSLVDLGRQWFMSNRGLGDVRETPRSQAFCSHAILSKDDILIINDAKKDPRFVNNPLVTGPPYIRFYGGAPLETPEGYKIGTFCIIDVKPWPNGLDLKNKQNLRELAAMAVEVLVARRRKRERDQEKNSQLVACTAHDLLTPFSGVELSLHLLKEDGDFQQKLGRHNRETMKQVEACSDVIQEICSNVRETYSETKSSFEMSLMSAHLSRVNVNNLVDGLYAVMEHIQKDVPLKITVDDNVPSEVITDSSKIFRCAMNYLLVAFKRTRKGMVVLRLFVRRDSDDGKKSLLFVTCEDTAPPVDLSIYEHIFKPPRFGVELFETEPSDAEETCTRIRPELCLFSVACEMSIVGGEYGFCPRNEFDRWDENDDNQVGNVSGSIFWFCLPCHEIDKLSAAKSSEVKEAMDVTTQTPITRKDAAKFHMSLTGGVMIDRQKRALIIEDSNVVRKMLTKILTNLNFEVSQAENGMEGLKKLKSTLFDITLCDFLMPIMDGLDCVQQYRDWEKYHRPWIRQRIVGMSAHATSADIERGMQVGMDDYKNKPVTVKVLSELTSCEEQIEVGLRLDEIETRGGQVGKMDAGGTVTASAEVPRNCTTNGRTFACLLISPSTEGEHSKLMQNLIKSLGWQSTFTASGEEALTWLKMRMWDLVLVDDEFAPLVTSFREWECKKRENPQKRVTMMTEAMGVSMDCDTQPPRGIDELSAKPLSLASLTKMLHRAAFEVDQDATAPRTASQ